MRSRATVILILVIWFVISFVTNILGPIMPAIIDTYHLSLTVAAFLPFSFFLAYGIMSIPAGILIERNGAKTSMLFAFLLNLIGAICFAFFPVYGMALLSLFVIGLGMAMLQVIINPLMRVAGGEENFAFYSVFAQGIFGLASFASPFFYVQLMQGMSITKATNSYSGVLAKLALYFPANMHWLAMYWLFALVFVVMLVSIASLVMPHVELSALEKAGAFKSYIELLKKPQVIIYFFGILSYVGLEQGLADWMSKFLNDYHGFSTLGAGATAIAWFWGSMVLGCLSGLFFLKILDSRLVLKIYSGLALVTITIALFSTASLSIVAFSLCGFCISLLYSIVFALALNSESTFHGSFSGILCSGIFGGALVPLIIGWLGDHFGLRPAMSFLYLPLCFIIWIGFWAKPLINNKTVRITEVFKAT